MVAMLEILVGIVEDDEGLVLHRRHGCGDFLVERVELVIQLLGIGLVGQRIGGVGGNQRGGNLGGHRLGVDRIEPEMGVEGAVVVVMICFGMIVTSFSMFIGGSTILVAVIMRFKGAAFAERQLHQTRRIVEPGDDGV